MSKLKKIVLLHFWNLLIESVILVYNSRGNEENKKVVEERVKGIRLITCDMVCS